MDRARQGAFEGAGQRLADLAQACLLGNGRQVGQPFIRMGLTQMLTQQGEPASLLGFVQLAEGLAGLKGGQGVLGDVNGQAQGALDLDAAVTEIAVFHDADILAGLEVGVETGDCLDLLLADEAALVTLRLAHGTVETGGVDQLDLTLAGVRLVVGQQPDVRANAGAEKDVGGHGDDGVDVVVFQQPAADLGLALASIASEQGRAGQDDGRAAAALGRPSSLSIRCWMKSIEPSDTRGVPAPKRPSKPFSLASRSTKAWSFSHFLPKGGLERQ